MADIYKIAGLCIRDGKLLVVRSKGKDVFFALGGKIEPGESEIDCLRRELKEEVGCDVLAPRHYQTFEGMNYDGTRTIRMSCYLCELEGDVKPSAEIEEVAWVGSDYEKQGIKLGGVLGLDILPSLLEKKLL